MENDMELTDRKKQILKIVTEEYIRSAEPIGSKAIVERMPDKISSATVRNELADLVEMGYLEQPHTSAGRVPSAKGYRLYVNELMERKALSPEETAKINDALSGQMKQVDQVISQAGQMVSSFVGYPTYAVADHRTVATVQRFELISVSESSFIAVVMLSDNRVKSQLMQLDLPVDAIAATGYEEQGGLSCIYVETAADDLGYRQRYWISVDSGLLVCSETLDGEQTVYRMSSYAVERPVPAGTQFALPDGTVLHTPGGAVTPGPAAEEDQG